MCGRPLGRVGCNDIDQRFELGEISAAGLVWIQTDFTRVGAHETAQEIASGSSSRAVGFDRAQNGDTDLRRPRDLFERQSTQLPCVA